MVTDLHIYIANISDVYLCIFLPRYFAEDRHCVVTMMS